MQAVTGECRLDPEEGVLLGVSGGPDSVTLLYLFCWLNEQSGWSVPLHVAHLNHRLRGAEADGDAAFVAELARHLRLPVVVDTADVAGRAQAESLSIEQAGRVCRYEFFERICLLKSLQVVALAHHADDNAETILHRIIRGTGTQGLAGIRPRRPLREGSDIRIVRPLLAFRRTEIEDYLRNRGIEYRQDASNLSEQHTRNRIRNEVLPFLRERFNPQIEEALIRLGEQARAINAYLAETSERTLDAFVIEHNDCELVLHCPPLVRKPRAIQTQLIRRALLKMGFPEGELTFGHLNAVADLAAGQDGSKSLDLPGGFKAVRRYARLVLQRASASHIPAIPGEEVLVAAEGTTPLPGFALEVVADRLPADEATIGTHLGRQADREQYVYEEWLDAESVHPPLVARTRRPGDRFFPLGMTGMKKISDFLIDEKIDSAQREKLVVLCDQLGPIWVVPLRIDERVRLTRATRQILRLRVRQLG